MYVYCLNVYLGCWNPAEEKLACRLKEGNSDNLAAFILTNILVFQSKLWNYILIWDGSGLTS